MIFIVLAIWFGYKKARDTGRNPWAWAAIAAGAFIGTQLVVGVAFGILIALGIALWGWDESYFDKYGFFANIPAIALSILVLPLK